MASAWGFARARKIKENQARIERKDRSRPILPRGSINDPSIVTVQRLIHQNSHVSLSLSLSLTLFLSLSLDGNPGVSTLNLATASRYFAGVAKSFPLGRLNWKQLDREIFRYCFIVYKNGCLQPGHPRNPCACQPATLDPALSIDESYRRETLSPRFSCVVFTVNDWLLFPPSSLPSKTA